MDLKNLQIELGKTFSGNFVSYYRSHVAHVNIQGRNFYIDYAYVLSSKVEFDKFKDIFKNLIHPAGFVEYAEYKIDEVVAANNVSRSSITISDGIAGTVNTNSSMYVIGTGTLFNVVSGMINVGSQIAINSEIKSSLILASVLF